MKEPFLYQFVRVVVTLWLKLIYKPVIVNKQNIPESGAVVVAGTHTNNLDGFMLAASTKRTIRFLGKDELLKGIGKWFFKNMGMIPVNRRIKDNSVMPAAIKALENGSLVGLFPEGTVNKTTGLIMPFKKGAAAMAIDGKCSIVPFAIIGPYIKFKKSVKIIFGESYYPETTDVILETKVLEEKVIKLITDNGE